MTQLTRNVGLLALASLLADISGEMLMAVFPFLLVAAGATGIGIGLAGGGADALGHLVKPLAGAWADKARARKPFIIAGYLGAAISRVGIALATWWPLAALFRGTDRVGKGLRSSPRDALLAESVPASRRGRAFGIHRAADTAGAFLGVTLALGMSILWGASAQTIVLVGALVGLLTVIPLLFVHEVGAASAHERPTFESPSPLYRRYLLVAGVMALGQVSYLFFLLRVAPAVGGQTGAIALYLLFNLVYAGLAYPAGLVADLVGKPPVLAAGFALFAASAALLVGPPTLALAVGSFVLLGLAFACIDGTERAYAADLVGSAGRATRLGLFQGTVGVATVVGGVVAGVLWDFVSPASAFVWASVVPLVALAILLGSGLLRGALSADRHSE